MPKTLKFDLALIHDRKTILQFTRAPAPRQVLITGGADSWGSSGYGTPTNSADVYDPATRRFVPAANMKWARLDHISAPVIMIGQFYLSTPGVTASQTLVAGGVSVIDASGSQGYVPTAEIFSGGSFHDIGPMNAARAGAHATMMNSGRVLIAGGVVTDPAWSSVGSAEYLHANNPGALDYSFTLTRAPMFYPRVGHTVTPIRVQGRPGVLVAGGGDNSAMFTAELYLQREDTFDDYGQTQMRKPRIYHAAALLNDGRVLICGGRRSRNATDLEWTQAEIFDPRTCNFSENVETAPRVFQTIESMLERRTHHTATTLPDGRVLVAGGMQVNDAQPGQPAVYGVLHSAELFDPVALKFTATGNMNAYRAKHTATPLGNGQVLIAGGVSGGSEILDSAEVYDASSGQFTSVGSMSKKRVFHSATVI